ncbi:hypothetical protein [Nocardia thraciensis]
MDTPARWRWFGLVAVSLGVALIVVDITMVNVIIAPTILVTTAFVARPTPTPAVEQPVA